MAAAYDTSGSPAWGWVLVAFVGITAGLRSFRAFAGSCDLMPAIPGRDDLDLDDIVKDALAEALEDEDSMVMRAVYLGVAACIAMQFVGVGMPAHEWQLRFACIAVLAWRAAAVVSHIVTYTLEVVLSSGTKSRATRVERRKSMMAGKLAQFRSHQAVCLALKVFFHALAAIVVFDNLGIEVKGFVSFMGVLGIALSLSAQYMLQDLLGYMALMVDASVVVGDMVIVGSDPKGEVEAMGYLCTKVRTLDGPLLIYRNRDFATKCVMNCSRQPQRMVTAHFELAATTPYDKLEEARECARLAVEEVASSTVEISDHLGGTIRWADYKMRFHGVWITALGEGNLKGIELNIYFYLDGTANTGLQFEATTRVYIALAKNLSEKSIATQGALLASTLKDGHVLAHSARG